MNLIEKESYDLKDHLLFWRAVRAENVIAYYARKERITKLGLQPLPTTQVTEYKAKEAINIQLLIESLLKSEFAIERWTLAEVSAETINSAPKNCFKKIPFIVTVLFDNDENNAFPYTCWEYIYYQDENNKWHKTEGLVDHNGMYYKHINGDSVYFVIFHPDAVKYGKTGQWTVKFKNKTVVASVTSSSRHSYPTSESRPGPSTLYRPQSPGRRQQDSTENTDTDSPSSSTPRIRRGRRPGGESGEPGTNQTPRRGTKRKLGSDSAPSPGEVGSRSRTVAAHGLSRLRRLQEEARDPPIILFTGQQNTLKCWRNRVTTKHSDLFLCFSSVWKWLGANANGAAKLLVAFTSVSQRELFLHTVHIPKGTAFTLGKLDSL